MDIVEKHVFKVNWKVYLLIIVASILLSVINGVFVVCEDISQLINSIATGGITSGMVAWLIEYYHVAEKNTSYNKEYNAIYAKLWLEIKFYTCSWNRYYLQCDKNDGQMQYSWFQYYNSVKNYYMEEKELEKGAFIGLFKSVDLYRSFECIVSEMSNLIRQQYYLKANHYMDETLYYHLINLIQGWDLVVYFLNKDLYEDDISFFKSLDNLNSTLLSVIDSWPDIKYLNNPGEGEWIKFFIAK